MFMPIVINAPGTVTKGLLKRREDLEIRGRVDTIYIIENGQNTEKSPGDLRRLTVTQTSQRWCEKLSRSKK